MCVRASLIGHCSMTESPPSPPPDPDSSASSVEPSLVTFGCRMNTYESEVIRAHVNAAGLKNVVVVNTCAVTQEAERQARQNIRRLKRQNPDTRIIVTGCAAQLNPATFAHMPEVERVMGNGEKLRAESWRFEHTDPVQVGDIMEIRETAGHLVEGFEGRTRAFVQVQQGCDHRCTFCIIPFARGPNRSVPLGPLVEQTQALVTRGYRELVLTGVDITAYGQDLPGQPSLGQIVRRLLRLVPDLPRLRLTSLDPVEIDTDLLHLFEVEDRLLPHVHLSAQSGDNMILKRMKRRHLRQDVLDVCHDLRRRRPDIVFGADFIVGFPTETEEMFQNTLRLVEEADLSYLHVFPYSARSGTPAARMPAVAGPVIRQRAAQLRDAGKKAVDRMLQKQIGQVVSVLFETEAMGRTPSYAPVTVTQTGHAGGGPCGAGHAGAIHPVRLIGFDHDKLIGEIVS